MTQRLTYNLAAMMLLIGLSIANWVLSMLTTVIWLSIINFIGAILAVYAAWRVFCRAMRIAKALDTTSETSITIVSASEPAADADVEDDHEDVGHPI